MFDDGRAHPIASAVFTLGWYLSVVGINRPQLGFTDLAGVPDSNKRRRCSGALLYRLIRH
ncbi:hypothetical protein [Psychromicrobium xiongbiense]|uniref:hypothetical protein n=1 Tax=Psychromicrobium xiongbiense TaxID=3051184 RepID=UPI00255335DB|nr:hypothetical protein [Psychromicrobium sp. YIM S02556]